jgi:hypothetical protein
VAAVLLAGLALAAAAFAAPKAGSYSATGSTSFTFQLKKGKCVVPANPNDANAPGSKRQKGLCFNSNSEPAITMTCPAGYSITGETLPLEEFGGLRLPNSGTLDAKIFATGAGPNDYSELDLSVHGKTASGFLHISATVGDGTIICDSGQLSFTAKHS